jgi:hypothetical protein
LHKKQNIHYAEGSNTGKEEVVKVFNTDLMEKCSNSTPVFFGKSWSSTRFSNNSQW